VAEEKANANNKSRRNHNKLKNETLMRPAMWQSESGKTNEHSNGQQEEHGGHSIGDKLIFENHDKCGNLFQSKASFLVFFIAVVQGINNKRKASDNGIIFVPFLCCL
jgi:hypothetical protein